MKISLIAIVLTTLFLTACQPVEITSNPTATKENPVSSPTSQLPTITPTNPPPIAAPTRSLPTPVPTLSPLDIAGTVLTELSIDETHASSPNRFCEWKRLLASSLGEAASLKYGNQFFTYVSVTCGNQDQPWVLVDKWAEQGLGYSIPVLLGWSSDGKYLYFYDEIIPDGCQPVGGFQQDLRQADLSTGKIRSYPIAWTGGMVLSPNTSKVVYYDRETARVGIYDLITSVELRFPFELPDGTEDWFAGEFTWSPDGQSVLFVIQSGDPCYPTGNSIYRFDLQLEVVRTLLEKENQTISIVEWIKPDRVLISIEGEKQWMDPVSGNTYPLNSQP